MSQYRKRLLQTMKNPLFITDGGMETTLIFHEGIELPCFAAFDLLKDDAGIAVLRRYYTRFVEIARANGTGLMLETPTWRASADWGARLGYDAAALADVNRKSVDLLLEIRKEHQAHGTKMVIGGVVGPRGDGYKAASRMTAAGARDYHAAQVDTLAQTDADMIAVYTMNYADEAIGIAKAAQAAAMPVAVSFTLETDGRLPSGERLSDTIERTDEATGGYPSYYQINCAHPTHFHGVLAAGGRWRERIRGIRANASKRSHQELDESTDLDAGDPVELGSEYRELRGLLPHLAVVGGCCGTDHRHVAEICRALKAA